MTPTLSFSPEAGAGFECRVDTGAFGPCSAASSHRPATALVEGPHRFEVRARDRVGNLGPAVGRAFVVDRTAPGPPSLSLFDARGAWVKTARVRVRLSAPEAGARFECGANGGALDSSPAVVELGPLPDGPNGIHARASTQRGTHPARRRLTCSSTSRHLRRLWGSPAARDPGGHPYSPSVLMGRRFVTGVRWMGGRFRRCPNRHRRRSSAAGVMLWRSGRSTGPKTATRPQLGSDFAPDNPRSRLPATYFRADILLGLLDSG